jgi:predicted RNase H-like HicB family nuclease
MRETKVRYLSIIIERNEGGYLARCPVVQGGFAEGDSIEEAVFNCVDVVKMIAEYRKTRGEPFDIGEFTLPSEMQVSISMPVGVD